MHGLGSETINIKHKQTLKKTAITIFIILTAVPVTAGVIYAFLYSVGGVGLLSTGWTTHYWELTLTSGELWEALGFSLFIATVVMAISLFFAITLVMSWIKQFDKGWLSYVLYLPLAFPAIVMAFFSFQLLSKGGFLSRLFYKLNIIDHLYSFPELVNDQYGIAIIFSLCLLIVPFFTILYANIYANEKIENLIQSAQTLGATRRQIKAKIIIPILLKKSTFTMVLFFIFIMGTYEIPLLLGRQSPSMLSVLVIRKLQRFNLADIPQAYAISVIYMVFISIVLWLVYRSQRKFVQTDKL